MSMRISNSTSFAATSAVSQRPHELRQDFRDVCQALRSGDLDAASSAFATLASDAPKALARRPDGAIAQIGTALNAGDLAGARSALATMLKSHLPQAGDQPPSSPSPSSPVSLTA